MDCISLSEMAELAAFQNHRPGERSGTSASAGYQTLDGPPFGTSATLDVEGGATPV